MKSQHLFLAVLLICAYATQVQAEQTFLTKSTDDDLLCSTMVDVNYCSQMSCEDVEAAITKQTERAEKCTACSRVLRNARLTLDACNARLMANCTAPAQFIDPVAPMANETEEEPLWQLEGCFQNEGEMFTVRPPQNDSSADWTVESCMFACQMAGEGETVYGVWALNDGVCECAEEMNNNTERYTQIMDHWCGEEGLGGCYATAVYTEYVAPVPETNGTETEVDECLRPDYKVLGGEYSDGDCKGDCDCEGARWCLNNVCQAPEPVVQSACKVTLYENGDFSGWSATFEGEQDFTYEQFIAGGAKNDQASAIKVEGENCVATCYHGHIEEGWAAEFPEGEYNYEAFIAAGAVNDDMSSLRVERRNPPMEPEPVVCKTTVYEHGDFSGWSATFEGERDFTHAEFTAGGAQNDKVSAIKVEGENCVATCYQHDIEGGWAAEFPEGEYNYEAFIAAGAVNDDMSSLRVEKRAPPPTCKVTVYQHGDFSGWSAEFGVGQHDYSAFIGAGAVNDDASALKVEGAGCIATCYQHGDFTGWYADFPEGSYEYKDFVTATAVVNDDMSSLKVRVDQGP